YKLGANYVMSNCFTGLLTSVFGCGVRLIVSFVTFTLDYAPLPISSRIPGAAEQRHGRLHEFLALTDGLSIAAVARTLRCCSRTIRNYVASRSPIPWHRIEMLRLLALEISATQGNPRDDMTADETPVVPNIEPDLTSPDVPASEFAWVGVHAPHFLSSKRSFALYVRDWNVVDKIRRAKREGACDGADHRRFVA
ncbi:hypothetical protein PQR05_38135, partial [Paraburkholderia sediminicola]|uniref:hypothetical protein n=1 Tax=Paraburkholderia sediminicola TaxID=458836 RepID=UPI0038BC1904